MAPKYSLNTFNSTWTVVIFSVLSIFVKQCINDLFFCFFLLFFNKNRCEYFDSNQISSGQVTDRHCKYNHHRPDASTENSTMDIGQRKNVPKFSSIHAQSGLLRRRYSLPEITIRRLVLSEGTTQLLCIHFLHQMNLSHQQISFVSTEAMWCSQQPVNACHAKCGNSPIAASPRTHSPFIHGHAVIGRVFSDLKRWRLRSQSQPLLSQSHILHAAPIVASRLEQRMLPPLRSHQQPIATDATAQPPHESGRIAKSGGMQRMWTFGGWIPEI